MIYEYECQRCGVFEHTQSINDPALEECPLCKEKGLSSEKPKRLISLSSFVLAGSGWSRDNYSK